MIIRTNIQKTHSSYVTSNNPQLAYALHTLNNANEYWPIETTMALLHTARKSKWMNNLENYYIQSFHQCVIITEQNEKEKSPIRINLWHTTAS